ncbi:hypothetical protein L227DRAFT_247139 [Lentinus tigrinus ALCF2SS1-6]|uniref:Uncharacterized protein n=1 Tax=Lentinus tigrinus ALCF2SS1-6 TaxID=1328759 RepID=A0A5C2S218_9APHY|nr:hypothetical protein L227DRAFT_247139 [Lentinus tigrinus ALCF2SS1-6]
MGSRGISRVHGAPALGCRILLAGRESRSRRTVVALPVRRCPRTPGKVLQRPGHDESTISRGRTPHSSGCGYSTSRIRPQRCHRRSHQLWRSRSQIRPGRTSEVRPTPRHRHGSSSVSMPSRGRRLRYLHGSREQAWRAGAVGIRFQVCGDGKARGRATRRTRKRGQDP